MEISAAKAAPGDGDLDAILSHWGFGKFGNFNLSGS
jgi:hypothetical protein